MADATGSGPTRTELAELTADFLSAFNENDLDRMMSFFAEDGIYEEFNGKQNVGLDEVRAAFAPQFAGAFGDMKFLDEDLIVDADARKVMASWTCTLEVKGQPTAWRGLDAMTFDEGGKLTHKLTYAKAKAPLFT
ncbi:MAG: nuclear transport factor 2 family protein [Actinomycetota bacterium]